MLTSLLNEFVYYARYGYVSAKQSFGMRLTGDKRHLCDRLIRGVRAGLIAPETVLTVDIRHDGVGSQALSRLSVEATARDLDLRYAYRPFESIAHFEGDPREWVARCESAFALGEGRARIRNFDLPMLNLSQFACDRKLWSQPHIVAIGNMFIHCDRNPAIYRSIIEGKKAVSRGSGPLRIAAHVRRGDVSERRISHRFTSNETVVATLKQVVACIRANGLPHEVTVFSNGDLREFADFADQGFSIDLASGALEVFNELRSSDVLLTAKSTFSYLAALYSNAIVLYEPFSRRPLPSWLLRSSDGSFATDAFNERVQSLSGRIKPSVRAI